MQENIQASVDEAALDAEPAVSAESEIVAEAAVPEKPKRRINQAKLQDNLWGWIFCLPLIIGTVWFVYYAFILAFLLSFTKFTNVDGSLMDAVAHYGEFINTGEWGAAHWYYQLFHEANGTTTSLGAQGIVMNEMGRYLFNTVFYMIGIPIGMILSVFFAVCMSRDIRGGNLFRVLYYLPCVASAIAIVYTFKIMFRTDGVMNTLLGLKDYTYPDITGAGGNKGFVWIPEGTNIGYSWCDIAGIQPTEDTSAFMRDPFWCQGLLSKTVIVIMSVWKGLGGTIILYVAGLSGVNAATKEAAEIDGANGWQIFWKVTMPDLYPTIFYNIVTSVIGGLQIYAEPELLMSTSSASAGFPNVSGFVALIYKYGLVGDVKSYGAGAAYGFFLAVIIFVLTLFQFWLDSRNKD